MKYILSFFLLGTMLSFKTLSFNKADDIIGKWMSAEDNNLEVEVFKIGSEYRAKVIWFDDSDDKTNPMAVRCDTKNPDKTLRTRKVLGLEVMHGFVYNEADDEWQSGKIYDASSGKEWNAKAWINSDGILKVRGYWHIQMFGQNLSFRKVQ